MDDSSLSEKGCYKLFGPELRKWVFLALGIRFILMPICGHYDMILAYGNAAQVLSGTISWFDVSADQASCLLHVLAVKFLQPFLKTFLLSGGTVFIEEAGWGFWRAYVATPEVFQAFALFKLLYLVFDVLSASMLLRVLGRTPRAVGAVKFWLFNPLVLFVTYIFGRYDVIAVFFLLASVWALKRRRVELAGLLFGLCITLRFYHLLFLPAYVVICSDRWSDRIKVLMLALIPLLFQLSTLAAGVFPVGFPLAMIVLFLLIYPTRSRQYWVAVLAASFLAVVGLVIFGERHVAKSLEFSGFGLITIPIHATFPFKAKLELLWHDAIYPVFVIYGLFLFGALTVKRWSFRSFVALWAIFLLLYYSFCFFHLPYLLVLVAAMALVYAWNAGVARLHLIQCAMAFMILFNWGAHPTFYLFAPLSPEAIFSIKDPLVWVEEHIGPVAADAAIGIPRSLFIATSLWMAWRLRKLLPAAGRPPDSDMVEEAG